MDELFVKIELLRKMMHEAALEKGISHPEVLKISQKLDSILNECYKQYFC
ncbi:MAG: aspartyl-phosphate phosphatase Spo0E family protein [Negativicutes bacterium]|nr:aspartyl-phosphate phosphatase Spo0E family protein [Negativicutes bacterium]